MASRLRRAKDKEEVYKRLVNEDDSPFLQFSHVFIMAASVGHLYGKSEELPPGGEQIPWSVFSDDADQAIVNAIAFASTSELKLLLATEEQMERKFDLIEKYANGGITILKDKILDAPGKPIDNLINFIFEMEGSTTNKANIMDMVDDLF